MQNSFSHINIFFRSSISLPSQALQLARRTSGHDSYMPHKCPQDQTSTLRQALPSVLPTRLYPLTPEIANAYF